MVVSTHSTGSRQTPWQIEVTMLLESIFQCYGYDFRHYALDSVTRRIRHRLAVSGYDSISSLQNAVLNDRGVADQLLKDLSINATQMFRDPEFFRVLQSKVISEFLADEQEEQSHLKIWQAGCATGEETYSLTILLAEAGLINYTLYATDFNRAVLDKARQGIFPVKHMRQNVKNYLDAGGLNNFSDYYCASYDGAIMARQLKRSVRFACHNLATDKAFSEVDLIVCRNVLIYFSASLQDRVLFLFLNSLRDGGILCLGSEEGLIGLEHGQWFDVVDAERKIYRKREKLVPVDTGSDAKENLQ